MYTAELSSDGRLLNFCEICRSSRAGFGFIVQLVSYLVMSFNLPLMSNHLDSKGYSPMFIGGSMSAVSLAYMVAMPFTFKLMEGLSRRGVIFIGLSLITNGMMITGMDRIYDFENPGIFTILGLIVFGVGFANITIPIMPEILEAVEQE